MFLLDTNTIIYYLKGDLPPKGMHELSEIIDLEPPSISIITKIEILGFKTDNLKEKKLTSQFVNGCFIFNLNNQIVNHTIQLRQNYKIKIPDAIIAATAIVSNMILITHNTEDFIKLEKLKYKDPFLI